MSFSSTSRDIVLQDFVLRALCADKSGRYYHSALDLNKYIENIDGSFQLGGRDFFATAKNVRLVNGNLLYAELQRRDGSWRPDIWNLNQFVANICGELRFIKPEKSTLVDPFCELPICAVNYKGSLKWELKQTDSNGYIDRFLDGFLDRLFEGPFEMILLKSSPDNAVMRIRRL